MSAHPILNVPIPFLLGAAVPQTLPVDSFANIPGWLATVFLGIWVTLWFLDKINKLPGQATSRHSTSDDINRVRDERLITLLLELTKRVDDLGAAVTELRVELAKKD